MQADVFCRVIDNYGDIGVTWRLVRQLQQEHAWHIRLWVDDLKSFKRLEPGVALLARQDLNGVEIIDWTQATDFTPRAVVIATFSCDLPEPYVENLLTQAACAQSSAESLNTAKSLWVNLEYLSAEDWVEGCHRLPSLRSDGLSAHFFFPGFTEQTGGLLRESDLLTERDAWQADRATQHAFLKNLGLGQEAIAALFPVAGLTPNHRHTTTANLAVNTTQNSSPARLINLFCYDNAPVASLIGVLGANPRQTVLLIPAGIHPQYQSGHYGQLFIERVPFLPQTEYDKVLWTADLNFVRGEDSIVRGIWAGKPLIWQIYPQTENTHLEKLLAWLARTGLPEDICKVMVGWNPESVQSNSDSVQNSSKSAEFSSIFQQRLQPANFELWRQHAHRFSSEQAALPDLATALNTFCLSKLDVNLTTT